MKEGIEDAYQIFKGQWLSVDKMEIPFTKTPEDYLLEKDIFRLLSKDALFLCNLIVGLPNEMYGDLNRVNWGKLLKLCKKEKNWGRLKVARLKNEIKRKFEKLRAM